MIFLGVIFVLSSCSTSKNTKATEVKIASVEEIAKNNFGDNAIVTYSRFKKFAAISKKLDTDPFILKIMVYDMKNKSILWGKKAIKGKIKWISRNELKVDYLTKQNKRNTLIYNAKTKQTSYK